MSDTQTQDLPTDRVEAWYIGGERLANGDGREIVLGERLQATRESAIYGGVECPCGCGLTQERVIGYERVPIDRVSLCYQGFHASTRIIDCLEYANLRAPWVYRVTVEEGIKYDDNHETRNNGSKLAGIYRTATARVSWPAVFEKVTGINPTIGSAGVIDRTWNAYDDLIRPGYQQATDRLEAAFWELWAESDDNPERSTTA